jgi:hypothetical protein
VPVTDSFTLKYTTYPPDYVGIEEYGKLDNVPLQTQLTVVYPNPFARELSISYQLAIHGRLSLRVYDALGREVCALVDGVKEPGYYTVRWDGFDDNDRAVPSGIYFVTFDAEQHQRVEKVVLLK